VGQGPGAIALPDRGFGIGHVDRRPTRQATLRASWIIYHRGGKDQSATPAETTNAISRRHRERKFRPTIPGLRQTLGDRVYRAYIDGAIHKDNGDLDGQAMLIVPITIVIP
jgi:hypothetical protein